MNWGECKARIELSELLIAGSLLVLSVALRGVEDDVALEFHGLCEWGNGVMGNRGVGGLETREEMRKEMRESEIQGRVCVAVELVARGGRGPAGREE